MITDRELAAFLKSLPPDKRDSLMREAIQAQAREEKQAERMQIGSKNQMSYKAFKHAFWPGGYIETQFQAAIDDLLTDVARYLFTDGQEGTSKAMIFWPPRHGKSTNIARMFPAWLLSRMPELAVIVASYDDDLAKSHSRFVRNLIERNNRYRNLFPHVKIVGRQQAEWYTSENGGMLAAGIGGRVTGFGGKLLVVDDIVKNRAEAESRAIRQRVKDAYANDLTTRVEQPGAILLSMTRWHTDDAAGWLLSQPDRDEWRVLTLPAIALANDPIGRKVGQALWSERYGLEFLNKQRALMGTYGFESLYQQQPISREAALFDTSLIEILDVAPDCKQVVRFYDMAVSAKSTADFTAGVKLGVTDNEDLIVLSCYREQRTPAATGEAIITNAIRDGIPVKIRLEADNAARVQLDYLLKDKRLRGYTIDAVAPIGDKFTRASPIESRVKVGKLKIIRANWNDAFLDELSVFPGGRNDDQVDALSGAYAMLSTEGVTIKFRSGIWYPKDTVTTIHPDGRITTRPFGSDDDPGDHLQELIWADWNK